MRRAAAILLALVALTGESASGEDPPETEAPGGSFGGRVGHRGLRAEGGGAETEAAVTRGLAWLARHQCEDGGWSAKDFPGTCRGEKCGGPGAHDLDVVNTSLATLAFLGAGQSEKHGSHRETVRKALDWLAAIQCESGRFGSGTDRMASLDHSLGTFAMVEAYGMTGASVRKKSAARAVAFLLRSRTPDGGWGKGARPKSADPAITMWGHRALLAARDAGGLEVEEAVFGPLHARLDAWEKKELSGAGPFFPRTRRGLLAGIVFCRNARKHEQPYRIRDDPAVKRIAEGNPSSAGEWLLVTESMFQVSGDPWKHWNQRMKKALLPLQARDGCAAGSFDPKAFAGESLGRVGVTACLTMCFESYYRILK